MPRNTIIGKRVGGEPQDEREHFIQCPRVPPLDRYARPRRCPRPRAGHALTIFPVQTLRVRAAHRLFGRGLHVARPTDVRHQLGIGAMVLRRRCRCRRCRHEGRFVDAMGLGVANPLLRRFDLARLKPGGLQMSSERVVTLRRVGIRPSYGLRVEIIALRTM
jgi:hypothetical protein